MELSPERKARFEKILAQYPVKRSALLPLLHLIQEQEGYVPREAFPYAAELLGLSPAQVHDTASFYTMYRFKPEGKTQIDVCTTLSCALRGADGVIEAFCKKLGVEVGETSADGKYTVHPAECLAACGGGPAVQVNGEWVEYTKPEDIEAILSGALTYRPFEWPKSPGEPIVLRNAWKPGSTTLDVYKQGGGYAKLKDHLSMTPDAIIDVLKKSNLRGRGGAGFPTGLKWSFLPKDGRPRYLCVNADEGEPGTFKDRLLMEKDPHQLIEGCVVSCHGIGAKVGYIYIRGEFHEGYRALSKALEDAYKAGYVGKNILGTGVDVELYIHRGAGSYECGEETALIESLEGKRGQPRVKPPFPAISGLYGMPTIVNNVETIICVPMILERGAEWFASYGTEKNGGPKLYCISGHVARPGVYEAPMGKITLRQLIYDYAGGIPNGRKLKCVIPGGSSTPALTPGEIDVAMDFDSLGKAKTMLGSAGTIIVDDSVCMVWLTERLSYFYKHESCGKCSPCREGTGWLLRLVSRIEAGQGTEKDLDTIAQVCDSIAGKTVCAFGDAAMTPPSVNMAKWRAEFEYHVREKRCWKSVAGTFEEALAKSGGVAATART
jgi:NADH-quinone oxidoreductase subunit F